jgi:hypothetical protein
LLEFLRLIAQILFALTQSRFRSHTLDELADFATHRLHHLQEILIGSRIAVLKNSTTPSTSLRILIGKGESTLQVLVTGKESLSVSASLLTSAIQMDCSPAQTRPGSPTPRVSGGRALQLAKFFDGLCQVSMHSIIRLLLLTYPEHAQLPIEPLTHHFQDPTHAVSSVSDSASTNVTACSVDSRRANCFRPAHVSSAFQQDSLASAVIDQFQSTLHL